MPRYVLGKKRISTKDAKSRAAGYRVAAQKNFIDRFPLGFGTVPEKIVYDQLSRRAIPFLYLNNVDINIPEIEFKQFFQADFIIPSLRIIIEVQGAHWHSQQKTIEADALKFAYYQQTGWRPLAWWDFDILYNVNLLFAADPQLSQYGYVSDASSEIPAQWRTKTDTSKGIRTLNRKRGQRLQYRKKAVGVKARKSSNYGGYNV